MKIIRPSALSSGNGDAESKGSIDNADCHDAVAGEGKVPLTRVCPETGDNCRRNSCPATSRRPIFPFPSALFPLAPAILPGIPRPAKGEKGGVPMSGGAPADRETTWNMFTLSCLPFRRIGTPLPVPSGKSCRNRTIGRQRTKPDDKNYA